METRNPWITVWTQPRATIAQIVEQNPNRSLFLLSWIYGFCSLLSLFQSIALGNALHWGVILLFGALFAPLYGYISFCIWSFFVLITGKLFKGTSSFKGIRASYAWSCVPIAVNIPIWFLLLLMFQSQVFTNAPQTASFSGFKAVFLFSAVIAKVVFAIWSLVIFLNGLVQVQGYSMIRAILNLVVAAVVLGVVFFILWTLLLYSMGSGGVAAVLPLIWT